MKLGHSDLDDFKNESSDLNSLVFKGKLARMQKKEGCIRTPPNRYAPSSSLSISQLGNAILFTTYVFTMF